MTTSLPRVERTGQRLHERPASLPEAASRPAAPLSDPLKISKRKTTRPTSTAFPEPTLPTLLSGGSERKKDAVPYVGKKSINKSRKIPNPFMLERSSHWPSSPSPGLGTQLALKPAPVQPQFLTDIEQYIERELLEVETMGEKDPEAVASQRLDVFSHAFEMFISRLSTYQPLLSEIHKEYDTAVSNLRREVMNFMAIRSELGTLKERTVVLVNKLKAEYTKKLREVQDASNAKDARLRQLYGEARSAKHEMEKAIEEKEKLMAKNMDQHESGAILAKMIELKEDELAKQKDTGAERDSLIMEREGLNDKIKSLQQEASSLSGEKEERELELKEANKVNQDLLTQLKSVNEEYSTATAKLQEQADNWQSRTQATRSASDQTPRPNMEALNRSLNTRQYATPHITVAGRSSVEVVGQLYWEIDRLCAELSKSDGQGDATKKAKGNVVGKVPRYLQGSTGVAASVSRQDLLELAKKFWMQHGMSCFEGRNGTASEAFATFMKEEYKEKATQMSFNVCQALLNGSDSELPKPCLLLLKLLQEDPDAPLSAEILSTVTSECTVTESRVS